MRIRSTESTPVLTNKAADRVHEKRDSADFSDTADRQNQENQKKQDEQGHFERHEVAKEEVQQAIESFGKDSQVIANGLSATTEGNGPGLKVILKDGQGKTVRQLTGEEFMKLRETLADQTAKRGKLLDQKL